MRFTKPISRIILTVIVIALTGCGGVAYEYNPKTGEVTKRWESPGSDTQHWLIDTTLTHEAQAKPAPKGFKSWAEYWRAEVQAWQKSGRTKYIRYLAKQRRARGLKDLPIQ